MKVQVAAAAVVQEHLLAATVVLAAAVDTTLQMLAAQGSQGKDLREPLALLVTARAAAAAPLWVAFRALLVLLAARVVLVSPPWVPCSLARRWLCCAR